jgi:hypothetical protein
VPALSGAVDNGPSSDKPARLSNATPEGFPSNNNELDTGERMGSNAAAAQEGGLPRQVRCCILRISLEIPEDLGQPAKSLSEPHQKKMFTVSTNQNLPRGRGLISPNPPEELPDVGGSNVVRASLQVSHDDLAAPLSKQGRGVKRKLNDSPKQGTRSFPYILFLDRAQLSSLTCNNAFRHLAAFDIQRARTWNPFDDLTLRCATLSPLRAVTHLCQAQTFCNGLHA